MKLVYYRGSEPNFGDELNPWLWPKLLPDFLDADESTAFIGIGSMLGETPQAATKKIVFGAGFVPEYHAPPSMQDHSWQIYFVRGPRTAAQLGLSQELAIGDSGTLLRTQVNLHQKRPEDICFMPHWESMGRGNWEKACARAGITLIDPRWSVDVVIRVLLRAKLVIAEAMHGAIIADAFRIPWVPVLPLNAVHRGKWYDWAESLSLTLNPNRLWPSSLTEFSMARTPHSQTIGETPASFKQPLLSRIKKGVQSSHFAPAMDALFIEAAAHRLRQLANAPAQLSADAVMDSVTNRMLEKLEQLKRDYGK